MSQHDYSLADQAGAAFRSDLNSALDAIVTGNSGATEPATKFARMVWLDTTANLVKQRNAANNAWHVRGTLAETLGVSRSSNTILAATDHGKYFVTTANFTQTLTAAATLADKWVVAYRVNSGVTVTLDPDTTETVDGATTKTLVGPCSGLIFCTGAAFLTYGFDVPAASATLAGIVELATNAETLTGSDATRAVTPAGLASVNGLVKLASGSASGASLDIVMTAFTAFKHKRLVFDLIPATDSVTLFARVSTDGGGNYDAGAGNYSYAASGLDDNVTSLDAGGGDSGMRLSFQLNIGNGAAEGISGHIDMWNTTDAAKRPRFTFQTSWISADATPRLATQAGGGARMAAQDTDAFQLLFGAGNITSGSYALYGWN